MTTLRKSTVIRQKDVLYRTRIIMVFVLIFLLFACGNKADSKLTPISSLGTSESRCIPPTTTFAFPVKPEYSDGQSSGQSSQLEILPSDPWQIETQLSDLPAQARSTSRIWAIRPDDTYEEIWVKRQWVVVGENNNHPTNEFWVYRSDTKKWVAFPEQIEDTNIYIGDLYVTINGSLWSRNYTSKSEEPFFSLYNEKSRQFELDNESKGIPDGKVVLDQKGVFWIIPHQGFIYSYDTASHKIKQHITLPELAVYDVALSPDGSIYILKGSPYIRTAENEKLFRFYPETEKVERLGMPLEPYPSYWNILIDHSGRLWLADRGWMEPNGTWYQIVRSPIFITNNVESGLDYRWQTPNIMLESSDNRLWFKSDNGLAWLDPEKGEWCWFTTYQSNIVEDSDHNLWMIADGKLYKYPLNP